MSDQQLRQLRLEVYQGCPSGCLHCYQGQDAGNGQAMSPLFSQSQGFSELLRCFVAQGGNEISLSGGEMLLPQRWPLVKSILLQLVRAGITDIRINTILAFANQEMLKELAQLPIECLRVQTGIDGTSCHDYLRFDGAMDKTLCALSMLREYGVKKLSVRTTLFMGHRVGARVLDNLADLPEIVRLCEQSGVELLKTKVVHASGFLKEEQALHRHLWEKEGDRLSCAFIDLVERRQRNETNVRFLFTNPLPSGAVSALTAASILDPAGVRLEQCACGSRHLAIDGDGYVYRCLFNFGQPKLALGNVLEQGLSEFLSRGDRHSYVQAGMAGRCGAFVDNLA